MTISKYLLILIGLLVSAVFLPLKSEARWHGGYYGPRVGVSIGVGGGYYGPGWRTGYWYHGAYDGRAGWWWVVGPSWYYYPAPLYPYPEATVQPLYVAQVPAGTPPPPAAPPPPAGAQASLTPPPAAPPTGAVPTTAAPTIAASPTAPAAKVAERKSQAFTYYCEKTKIYYSTGKTCDAGWIATPVKGPI